MSRVILYAAAIFCAMLVGACDSDNRKGETGEKFEAVPPAPTTASLSGEAFLKLQRGTERLAGMRVSLHDRSFMEKVAEASQNSDKALASVNDLESRIAFLERAVSLRKKAIQWHEWKEKLTGQRADFEDKGYEDFPIFDPLSEETITLSWHKDREGALARFDRLIFECESRSREALEKLDDIQRKLAIADGQDVEVLLADLKQKVKELRIHVLRTDEILQQAQLALQPIASVLTDADGVFHFESLSSDRYVIVAGFRDAYSGDSYFWCMPVEVGSGKDEKIVLAQGSCYYTIEANAPLPRVEKPDPMLPPRALRRSGGTAAP